MSGRGKSPAPSSRGASAAAKDARKAARDEIDNLVLWKRPLDTLYHFGIVFFEFLASPMHAAMDPKNILVVGPVVMALIALFVSRSVEGPHSAALERMEHQFWYSMWWFGLGVASSVGLGTGAHTGTLFLFPHICAVVRTAENNKKLDFDPTHNIFSIPSKLADSFKMLPESETGELPFPSFWILFFDLLFPIIIWGVGTALGELPPYLVAYSHAKAGEQDDDYEELMAEAKQHKQDGKMDYSITGMVAMMSDWMVDFLQNNGFWGVLLFSSYPNALFDMCGMCCGHAMMPMWKFLIAVSIGKGFIKAPMQGLLFVWIFSQGGKASLISFAKSVLNIFTPLPQWSTCATHGLGLGCTPGGVLLAVATLMLTRHIAKYPKMMLMPLVLGVTSFGFGALSVASMLQEKLKLVDQMDVGLDKVLAFCEGGAPKEEAKKSFLGLVMSYLSPKAIFGYFVVSLVLFFVFDTINKLAQGHAKEMQEKAKAKTK